MIKDFSQSTFIIGRKNEGKIRPLGTAFLINENTIATALHVVNSYDKNLVVLLPKLGNIDSYQDTTDKRCTTFPVIIKAANPMVDLCLLEPVGLKYSVGCYELGSLDDVHVGQDMGIYGFPHCTDGRIVLTFQKAELGAKQLINNSGILAKYGTINILTRPGQSGSPVFDLDTCKVVGVLVGGYTANKTQAGLYIFGQKLDNANMTSYCISIDYIKEML